MDYEGLLAQAVTALDGGDYKTALVRLAVATKRADNDFRAARLLGVVYRTYGRYRAAEKRTKEALGMATHPYDTALILRDYGQLEMARNKLHEAKRRVDASLSLLVTIDSSNARRETEITRRLLGLILYKTGEKAKGRQFIQQATPALQSAEPEEAAFARLLAMSSFFNQLQEHFS